MKVPVLSRLPKDVRAEMIRMTMPVMLEQALLSSMGLINMMMASRLSEFAAAPIGMVDALHMIFILFFSSIGSGATVIVAQRTGRGETHIAGEAARQSMATSVLVALALTLLLSFAGLPIMMLIYGPQQESIAQGIRQYLYPSLFSYPAFAIVTVGCGVLRGTGDMRTPMKVTVLMSVLNTLFSYLLIYGVRIPVANLQLGFDGLGLAGAGWSLFLARGIAAVILLYVLIRGHRSVHLRLRGFRFNWPMQKELFALGVPLTTENVLFQIGKLVLQVIVVASGPLHTTAHAIGNSIFLFVTLPGNAFSIAAMPVVGHCVGRGDYEDARDRLFYINTLSNIGLLLVCTLMMIFAHPLIGLFTTNAEVAEIVYRLVILCMVFIPTVWSFSFILSSGLKGAGDTKYTMVTSIIAMWVFRVLLGYILGNVFHLGAVGIFFAMGIDWVVRAILYYFRLRGDKWQRSSQRKISAPLEQE